MIFLGNGTEQQKLQSRPYYSLFRQMKLVQITDNTTSISTQKGLNPDELITSMFLIHSDDYLNIWIKSKYLSFILISI